MPRLQGQDAIDMARTLGCDLRQIDLTDRKVILVASIEEAEARLRRDPDDVFLDVTTCDHCGKTMPDDPGAYYHRAACEAKAVAAERDTARAAGASREEIARVEKRLEMARYVGD